MKTAIIALALLTTAHAQFGPVYEDPKKFGLFIGGGAPRINLRDPVAEAANAMKRQEQSAQLNQYFEQRNRKSQDGVEARVVKFLEQRIADGSADAAYDLAIRYSEGKGVPESKDESVRLFRLSAERGNAEAMKWVSTNLAAATTNAVTITNQAIVDLRSK